MDLDAGHVLVIDLQSPRRFFQSITGERDGKGAEQHETASDDREGHDVIGEISFHEVLR